MNVRLIASLCLVVVIIIWGYYALVNHEKYLWSLVPYGELATAAELRDESLWLEPGITRIVIKYQPWLIALFVSTIVGILGSNLTVRWSISILLYIGFLLSPLIAWTAWLVVPLIVPLILIIVLLVFSLKQMRPSELMLTSYLTLHYVIFIMIGFLYFSDIWDIIIGD